jgi:hypothetical protein
MSATSSSPVANELKCALIVKAGAELQRGVGIDESSDHAEELAEELGFPYLEDRGSPRAALGTDVEGRSTGLSMGFNTSMTRRSMRRRSRAA